jgi:NADPH:quinone reductase-like Zn-dependent oxidoreductase
LQCCALHERSATVSSAREALLKAIAIRRYGGNEHVRLEEFPKPEPGPGDLLVEVHAASVNPVDFKIRNGGLKILTPYRMPLILGNDLSGVVAAVGPGVTRFRPGDEIYSRLDKDRIGTFAEFVLVRETAAARKPSKLTHTEAASIPLVGLTAWQALVELGHLSSGQSVLIHAGSGGVGTFAIQLARHLGAHVATTVGARNKELVRGLGAETIVDYKTTRFEDAVKDVDVVLDTQGGETLERSFAVAKVGGVVVSVGGTPDGKFAKAWGLNPFLVLALTFMSRKVTRLARIRGARYEYLFMRADGEALGRISALIDQGAIRSVLDKTFPLDQTAEALAYSESGRATGKVVITVK